MHSPIRVAIIGLSAHAVTSWAAEGHEVNLLKQASYTSGAKSISRTVQSDVPDLVSMHGTLRPSQHVADNATFTYIYRTEPVPFPGEPAFVWTIYGEKGDIKITSPAGPYFHTDSYGGGVVIETLDRESGEVKQHDWAWPEWQRDIPVRARNTAELYERFAAGDEKSYANFQGAVARHEEIEQILKPFFR